MRVVKKMLCIVLVVTMAASGILAYQSYSMWQIYNKLKSAGSIEYDVRLHADASPDFNTNALLLLSGDECRVKGVYSEEKMQGTCYDESGTSFLEFYRDPSGETVVNLSSLLGYMISYVGDQTHLPLKYLWSYIDGAVACYIRDSQFREVTGLGVVPEPLTIPRLSVLDVIRTGLHKARPGYSYFLFELNDMKCYKLSNTVKQDIYVGIGDCTGDHMKIYVKTDINHQPIEVMIDLDLKKEVREIEIPESSVSDEYLGYIKVVFDEVMSLFGYKGNTDSLSL